MLTWELIWINLGYGLMLAGLLARDILWLRLILMSGQACLCIFALLTGAHNAAVWNALFVLINAVQSVLVWRERREIRLPDTLELLYSKRFKTMLRSDFLKLWTIGSDKRLADAPLLEAHQDNDRLYLVCEGTAAVWVRGKRVAALKPGAFVAEMSFLTNEPTSADVRAEGELVCRYWTRFQLDRLQLKSPRLWNQLQAAIGHDLVGKLRVADQQATLMFEASRPPS